MDPTPATVRPSAVAGPDGRVAERFRAVGFDLTWSPPTPSLLGVRNRPVPVEVIDLSVAGALLVAPANPWVRRGLTVGIAHGDLRGTVKVRHVHAAPAADRQFYGVLFLQLDPALEELVFRRVGAQRGDVVRRWDAPVPPQ